MATAPTSYASPLIQALRQGAGPMGASDVFLRDNPVVQSAPINFTPRGPARTFLNAPPVLQMQTVTPMPSFSGGGGEGNFSFMPNREMNFEMPAFEQNNIEPDVAEIDAVEESVAESFPVPEPGRIYSEELPPLKPPAQPVPVPEPPEMEFFDLPPLPDEPPAPPPEYDEIPEGEIEVGPPGSSQPARDALDGIGDITEMGDPLDEWDPIELPIPEIPLPDIPQPEPEVPSGDMGGGAGEFYVPPQRGDSVSPDPLDEWDWVELEEPEIPLPEIPAAGASYGFSNADLMDFLLNEYELMGL